MISFSTGKLRKIRGKKFVNKLVKTSDEFVNHGSENFAENLLHSIVLTIFFLISQNFNIGNSLATFLIFIVCGFANIKTAFMDPNITYFKTAFMFSGFFGQFSAISSEPLDFGSDFALVPALKYNIIVLKKQVHMNYLKTWLNKK